MRALGIRASCARLDCLVGLLTLGLLAATRAAGAAQAGVVVEELTPDSALAAAGIRVGDVILSWQRSGAPELRSRPRAGRLDTWFDWSWLIIEEPSPAALRFEVQRPDGVRLFEVGPGEWGARVRPVLRPLLHTLYVQGQDLLDKSDERAGIETWQRLLTAARKAGEVDRAGWAVLRMAQAQEKARHTDEARASYRLAEELAKTSKAQVAVWEASAAFEEERDRARAIELLRAAADLRRATWGPGLGFAATCTRLGVLLTRANEALRAEEVLTQAVSICEQEAPGSPALARALRARAELAGRRGDFDLLDSLVQRAHQIQLARATQGLDLAHTLNLMGSARLARGELQDAQKLFLEVLAIADRCEPEGTLAAVARQNLGRVALNLGRLDEAERLYREALRLVEESGPGSPRALGIKRNVCEIKREQGHLDQAHACLEEVLDGFRRTRPGSTDVAGALSDLATVLSGQGDWERAEENIREALAIYEGINPSHPAKGLILHGLGNLLLSRGSLAEAEQAYEAALAVIQKVSPKHPEVATILNSLGVVSGARGDLDRAEGYFRRAYEIAHATAPEDLPTANALANLGEVRLLRNDLAGAAEYHERALAIVRAVNPRHPNVSAYLEGLATIARASRDWEKAQRLGEQSLEIAKTISSENRYVILALYGLGEVARSQELWEPAERHYRQALAISARLMPAAIETVRILDGLAAVLARTGRIHSAVGCSAQGLSVLDSQIARLGASRESEARYRAENSAIYRHAIELLLAAGDAERAFEVLESYRARSLLAMLAERDLLFAADVPAELTQARRRWAQRYQQAQNELADRAAENEQSRQTLAGELLELQSEGERILARMRQASPRLAALRYPVPLGVDEAQAALAPGTLLLSFSVGESSTNVFVLTHTGSLSVALVPVGREELTREVDLFSSLIEDARPGSPRMTSLLAAGRRLYGLLIAPLEPRLAGCERVLVIPDGPLHRLPMGALVRPLKAAKAGGDRDWQYLAEWRPLHYAVSVTVYNELRRKIQPAPLPASSPTAAIQFVAFGDPSLPATPTGTLAGLAPAQPPTGAEPSLQPLPQARQEVTRIAQLFEAGAQVYLDEAATEQRAKTLPRDVRLVHFATHAVVDTQVPLDSALVLATPGARQAQGEDGLLRAWEILENVRLDADLVTLSACQTASGPERGGEGLISLTRAFQHAGARAVLGALWKVADETTSDLMVSFYRHLLSGKPKDQALQAAQLELLHSGQGPDPARPAAPYYWAGFQLFGLPD